MSSYEQKIADFADGKTLVRLSRSVRDRADSSCDACGSAEPRTLYGLCEQQSGRFYFVGKNCLKELVRSHVILRRFGRTSAQAAYEKEMGSRAEEETDGTHLGSAKAAPEAVGQQSQDSGQDEISRNESVASQLLPAVLVIDSADRYEALACLLTSGGAVASSGRAAEPRYEAAWRRQKDGALLLDRVERDPGDALRLAVIQAWREACSNLTDWIEPQPLTGEYAGARNDSGVAGPLRAVSDLVARTPGVSVLTRGQGSGALMDPGSGVSVP